MSNLAPETNLALMYATTSGTDSTNAARKVEQAKKNGEIEKIEAAAQEFEAVFIAEMMKPMFEGIEAEAPFGGGKGEEVFRGMLLQEYGKITAQSGGLGFADQVKDAMIQMQDAINNGGNDATNASEE